MKNNSLFTLSGISLAAAGICILLAESIGINITKIIVPLLIVISGALSFLFGSKNTALKMPSMYHRFQGGLLATFGIILGIMTDSLDSFLTYSTYLIVFVGLFEIIFGFLLINTDFKFKWNNLIFKIAIGLMSLIGGVLILATSVTDEVSAASITGAMILLLGIGFLLFAQRIPKEKTV